MSLEESEERLEEEVEEGNEVGEGNEAQEHGDHHSAPRGASVPGSLDEEGEGREAASFGVYNARDVVDSSLDAMQLPNDIIDEIVNSWNSFLRTAETREMAGDAIFAALFEQAPSLQNLFKSPRAVFVDRFMSGIQQILNTLKDPKGLKVLVESFGFQHLDFDLTVPRVIVFRDSMVDLMEAELVDKFNHKAKDGWATLLNYIGGACVYVKIKYADRLKILASSWATATNTKDDLLGEVHEDEENHEGDEGGASGELAASAEKGGDAKGRADSGGNASFQQANNNTSVPTTFEDMFMFNAAVMGFGNQKWMGEVLASFDNIVRNVSNSYRLQEECDFLSLRINLCGEAGVVLGDFKAILLASLRSLVPKDWDSGHEVAWTWLWENVERMLQALFGKATARQKTLDRFYGGLTEDELAWTKREVFAKFFAIAPAGQEFFNQSFTRLIYLATKVLAMTLTTYSQPKVVADELSKVGLLHVGYGIPSDLLPPYVIACTQTVRMLTSDESAEDAFRWSMSLMARYLGRVVNEGATIVMKAINDVSVRQLKKAIGCAPRGKRYSWMLSVQVGTQNISPLLWSVEQGNVRVAEAMIKDIFTFRADRDNYYYGMESLFQRHPDIIKRLCDEAPDLLNHMLDGLIWRARTTDNGMRRVNYYIKYLVMDGSGTFNQALEWFATLGDPDIVCHPVLNLVADSVWNKVARRSFLLGKSWLVVTLVLFVVSQAILSRDAKEAKVEETRDTAIRIVITFCRVLIYVLCLGSSLFRHMRHILLDVMDKRFVKVLGRCNLPECLFHWQEVVGIILTFSLVFMLMFEPLLNCMGNDEEIILSMKCHGADIYSYSVFSSLAMFCFCALLIDFHVLSTRISAFALVCTRIMSEVGLFILGLAFLVFAFAAAISSLHHQVHSYEGLHQAALSLLTVALGMVDGDQFDTIQTDGYLFFGVLLFIISSIVFLPNLLIAQLACAYQNSYKNMLGYARLGRCQVITETMPSVSSKRWEAYLESLRLDEKLEFGEGDVGVAGGVQILEPANLNITTEEVIKRFGGSTATSSPWPEDESELTAGTDDKVDRMERMMERSLKKVQAASKRSRRGGAGGSSGMSGSKGSGSAKESGSAGEGSSEHSQQG